MPIQWQKDVLAVQFMRRIPRGSDTWALKASRAVRSVSLLRLKEELGRAAASSKMPSSVIWLHGLTLAISVLASVVSPFKIKLE
jgi:hypothetical protein